MNILHAIILAIVEGLTEFLPISSTAHMIFTSSILGIGQDKFVEMFQVSIQFGAILAVVALYWKKFFDFKNSSFYFKLIAAVIPALVLGKLFDDKIEAVLGNPIPIAIVLIIGGIVLLFIDNAFNQATISDEKEIPMRTAITIGFWQCLAMMPGTSRSAASIIGGMQQKLSRKAVTVYSIFLKDWNQQGMDVKGYELLQQGNNLSLFFIGNIVAFLVAILAIKSFISLLTKYGFKLWGWYRIVVGFILIIYFIYFQK